MPAAKAALWLLGTALIALAVYYFVGVDQGAYSVFGKDTHVHEFVHDARHFLGFPCH
nr:CbtB-domain containing protein [Streptomyces sp. HPF1205]